MVLVVQGKTRVCFVISASQTLRIVAWVARMPIALVPANPIEECLY